MNLFQWVTVPLMLALFVRELVDRRRRAESLGFWLIRCLVWAGVAVTVADPLLVQRAADAVGIGLGVNLVVYLFVLLFLATTFYFYSEKVQMQRQITQLTRHLAIREARRGAEGLPLPPAQVSGPPSYSGG
jgi:hypothetical protein